MATITSLGIGSGLDINTIVDKLVALEKQPLQQMQTDAGKLQNQVSVWGKVQSLFSGLKDASNALTDISLWSASTATSSNDTAVSAVGGSGAAPGNYNVAVSRLASSQTLASASTFASATSLIGSGTLTLQSGTWNTDSTTFTPPDGGQPTTLQISDTDTLTSLRDKINAAGAGVTASLVTDASGVRLALRSTSSGEANGFRVQAAASGAGDGGDLSRVAYDPPAGTTGMLLKETAANAQATVNGIAVTSATNSLDGAVEGLTLNLRQVTTDPVAVTVTRSTDSVNKSVKGFVDAYNALASFIADQTKFDATSKTGGPLQGDSAATGLISRMRAVLNTPSSASASFSRLSDMGLTMQRGGTISIDNAKLTKAMGNLDEMKKAFSANDVQDPSATGFARRYANLADGVLSVDGTVTTRTDGLQKLIGKNQDEQTRLNSRVDAYQARLVAQYTAMDASMSKLSSLSSYVTQQLAAMNKTSA